MLWHSRICLHISENIWAPLERNYYRRIFYCGHLLSWDIFFLSKIFYSLSHSPYYFLQNVSIKLWDASECTIEISWDIWSGFRNVLDFMALNKCLPLSTAELKKSKSMPSREPPQHEIMVRWSDNLPNEERSMR